MYLGIDIGGTKTLLTIFSEEGELLESAKFPTPKDYPEFLQLIKADVGKLQHSDFKAVGIGSAGRLDRSTGTIISSPNLGWENVSLQADIEKILHTPTILENDAKLAGLAEAKLIEDDYPVAIYITISTGIGCGVVRNGKLDPSFLDMETGWAVIEHNGKFEHWEEVASGQAIVKKYGKYASEINDEETWKEIVRTWHAGLSGLFATIQPDALIIGGSIGTYFEKYESLLKAEVNKYATPMVNTPDIFQAQRPEEAVAYGCYHLARDTYGQSR